MCLHLKGLIDLGEVPEGGWGLEGKLKHFYLHTITKLPSIRLLLHSLFFVICCRHSLRLITNRLAFSAFLSARVSLCCARVKSCIPLSSYQLTLAPFCLYNAIVNTMPSLYFNVFKSPPYSNIEPYMCPSVVNLGSAHTSGRDSASPTSGVSPRS